MKSDKCRFRITSIIIAIAMIGSVVAFLPFQLTDNVVATPATVHVKVTATQFWMNNDYVNVTMLADNRVSFYYGVSGDVNTQACVYLMKFQVTTNETTVQSYTNYSSYTQGIYTYSISDDIGAGKVVQVNLTAYAGKPDILFRFTMYDAQKYVIWEQGMTNTRAYTINLQYMQMDTSFIRTIGGSDVAISMHTMSTVSQYPSSSKTTWYDVSTSEYVAGPYSSTLAWPVPAFVYQAKTSPVTSFISGAVTFDTFNQNVYIRNNGAFYEKVKQNGAGNTTIPTILAGATKWGEKRFYEFVDSINTATAYHDYFQYISSTMTTHARSVLDSYIMWDSWNAYQRKTTQSDVNATVTYLKIHLPQIKIIEIDDGWQKEAGTSAGYGDWEVDTTKFPDINQMTAYIASQGMVPALWWTPFLVGTTSTVHGNTSWLLKDSTGALYVTNGYDVLDYSNNEVRTYINTTFDRLLSFGFKGFKIDFWSDNFRRVENLQTQDASKTQLEWMTMFWNAINARINRATGGFVLTGVSLTGGNPFLGRYIDAARYSTDIDPAVGSSFTDLGIYTQKITSTGFTNFSFYLLDPDQICQRRYDGNGVITGNWTQNQWRIHMALAMTLGGMIEVSFRYDDTSPLFISDAERTLTQANGGITSYAILSTLRSTYTTYIKLIQLNDVPYPETPFKIGICLLAFMNFAVSSATISTSLNPSASFGHSIFDDSIIELNGILSCTLTTTTTKLVAVYSDSSIRHVAILIPLMLVIGLILIPIVFATSVLKEKKKPQLKTIVTITLMIIIGTAFIGMIWRMLS